MYDGYDRVQCVGQLSGTNKTLGTSEASSSHGCVAFMIHLDLGSSAQGKVRVHLRITKTRHSLHLCLQYYVGAQ